MISSTPQLRPARALPLVPYIGGKRSLSRHLCTLIDSTPHETYAEVFVGGGGVFLKRQRRPRAEAINDISRDVTTLFRVVRRHYQALVDELDCLLASRDEFERQLRADPDTLTDIERAARFVYLQRLCFGGKVTGRTFGVDRRTPARFNHAKLRAQIRALGERLATVVIERLPYADFIRRYDGPETLFYLDPPYAGCEGDYGAGVFGPEDFARLAEQLSGISGQFILSINDTPAVRETFAAFAIEEVAVTYTIGTASAGAGKRAGELIVTGGGA